MSAFDIENIVCERIKLRAAAGYTKYGVGVDRDDLSLDQWLQHLQEELLDAAVYVERIRAFLATEGS